jgi:hypothetical protein
MQSFPQVCLKRIRERAASSQRMFLAHADILIEQGLIGC